MMTKLAWLLALPYLVVESSGPKNCFDGDSKPRLAFRAPA